MMNVKDFLNNRALIDSAEMERHCREWVALSADGSTIVAAAPSLELLEAMLAKEHIDPQSVHFEYLPGAEEQDSLFTPEFRHEVPVSE